MSADRLRVIYNAVDADRLHRGDATGLRAALGIGPGELVFAGVGSLIHRKAHDVTIRAAAALNRRGVAAHLLVCGDGEESPALRALAQSEGVADRVHFLGYRGDVGAVLRDATDVFVTSARDETLGLNVLEAQWLGLPVVASDIPAHREALVVGRTGLVVPLEAPDAVADAVAALAADPGRRATIGEAGRAVARTRFTMDRYVAEFEALYASLLARPRRDFGWVHASSWPRAYTRWMAHGVRRRLGLGRAAG
jgi:glycosyltransferase involved in cell wall biosynthesis